MSNSKLVDYTKISPNSSNPRNSKIKKITIHHVAGNLSVEAIGNVFAPSSRQASANYGIDSNGRVGMYVEEKNRAWTSGNADNDHQAITIEVANNGGSPDWPVSDKALSKLIDLCVDICKRNGIEKLNYTGDTKGNLTRHNMFQATVCPGPYLQSKFPYIAKEVNKRLGKKEEPKKEVSKKKTSNYTGNSIVDYLNSIGENSSFSNRKKLAKRYGIKNYSGTASQNSQLLNLMRDTEKAPSTSKPKKSNAGDKVIRDIQTTLNDRYNTGLVVDGIYGPRTKKALIKGYQTELNKQFGARLVIDGIWGPKTESASVTARKGARGNLTWILQAMLYCEGYNISVDGIFGKGTEKAVREFQKDKKLNVDGIPGKNTFRRLFN